jgi:hypothetical protein
VYEIATGAFEYSWAVLHSGVASTGIGNKHPENEVGRQQRVHALMLMGHMQLLVEAFWIAKRMRSPPYPLRRRFDPAAGCEMLNYIWTDFAAPIAQCLPCHWHTHTIPVRVLLELTQQIFSGGLL